MALLSADGRSGVCLCARTADAHDSHDHGIASSDREQVAALHVESTATCSDDSADTNGPVAPVDGGTIVAGGRSRPGVSEMRNRAHEGGVRRCGHGNSGRRQRAGRRAHVKHSVGCCTRTVSVGGSDHHIVRARQRIGVRTGKGEVARPQGRDRGRRGVAIAPVDADRMRGCVGERIIVVHRAQQAGERHAGHRIERRGGDSQRRIRHIDPGLGALILDDMEPRGKYDLRRPIAGEINTEQRGRRLRRRRIEIRAAHGTEAAVALVDQHIEVVHRAAAAHLCGRDVGRAVAVQVGERDIRERHPLQQRDGRLECTVTVAQHHGEAAVVVQLSVGLPRAREHEIECTVVIQIARNHGLSVVTDHHIQARGSEGAIRIPLQQPHMS